MLQFKERYLKELTERREEVIRELCVGSPQTFSQDENLRGKIQSFDIAIEEFNSIWNIFFTDQEELI